MQHPLDHEKLDVYPIELEFVAWSTDLMVELRNREDRLRYEIEDEDEDDGGESPSVGGKNDLARVKGIPSLFSRSDAP